MTDLINPMVWIDLEMTGLEPHTDHILEIAVIVTDSDLNVIAEGPDLIIHQPKEILSLMNDYVRDMHTKSGLLEKIAKSTVTVAQAEAEVMAFLKKYMGRGQAPLCGNSIWQDRRFLAEYMPTLNEFLHYRLIDVSTVKELARRWAPDVFGTVQKQNRHRALDDIQESIQELQHYRSHWLKGKSDE